MADSTWVELSSLPSGEKLLDRYGLVASRFSGAERAGRVLPATFLLDKKGFRKTLAHELPPAHGVIDIAGDRQLERRSSRAARARERTLSAPRALELPLLPEGARRVLVWTSPVVRPRGIELPFLVQSLDVEAAEGAVRKAIGELWASVYFSECLREIERLSLRKVELATGLTVLTERESSEQMSFMELLLEQEPASLAVPLPGRPASRAESTLELALGRSEVLALREALSARFRRVPEGLFGEGQCRWELDVETVFRLSESRHRHERRALAHLTGVEPPAFERAPPSSSKIALGRTFAREILRQSALGPRVLHHERAVKAAALTLSELDLAVLPDDGLKRTIEDAFRLFEENTKLAAEALLSSEMLVAGAEELHPESARGIDAGLEGLTWLATLSLWEERLAVVRNDGECVAALAASAPLPDGAGRRALVEAERALASFRPDLLSPLADDGEGPRALPSPWIVALARLAAPRPTDVGRASRETRFAADRRVAAAESGRGQLFGVSLAAARSVARDAVLLRESTRSLGLTMAGIFRRIVLDVDRRLRRIEPTLPFGAAFECTLDELVAAVDLRGSSLLARVLWRRAERAKLGTRKPAWWSPVGLGESSDASGVRWRAAAPLSAGEARGPLLRWDGAEDAGVERDGGAAPVLLATSLTPSLILALPYVSGLLVRHGTRSDSVAVVARTLGVPLVAASEVALAPGSSRVILRAGSAEASWRSEPREELA